MATEISFTNVIYTKREIKEPTRYVDDNFFNMMIQDVPDNELFAAVLDDDLDDSEILEEPNEIIDTKEANDSDNDWELPNGIESCLEDDDVCDYTDMDQESLWESDWESDWELDME